MEVKHIEPGNPSKKLEGLSGKTYKEIELTAGRFPAWQKAWCKAQFNINILELFKLELANKVALSKNGGDLRTVCINNEKILNGAAAISDEKAHHWVEIVALFYVTDDEDISWRAH